MTTLKAADFLILSALHDKPMTTTELGKTLQISRTSVVARIKRFQNMGLILRRHPDKRWVIKLIVRVETLAETAEEIGVSTKMDTPRAVVVPEPEIVNSKAIRKPILPTPEPREEHVAKAPDMGAPEPAETPVQIKKPRVPVSKNAQSISDRFQVPAHLDRMGGEVKLGAMGGCCKCGKGTPFSYGGNRHLCPLCARDGGGR
jgi:biotin operon repressor